MGIDRRRQFSLRKVFTAIRFLTNFKLPDEAQIIPFELELKKKSACLYVTIKHHYKTVSISLVFLRISQIFFRAIMTVMLYLEILIVNQQTYCVDFPQESNFYESYRNNTSFKGTDPCIRSQTFMNRIEIIHLLKEQIPVSA